MLISFLSANGISSWLPPEASYHAYWLDKAFLSILAASVFVLVLVTGLALLFIYGRRGGPERSGGEGASPALQTVWVLAAVSLAVFAFSADFCGFLDRSVPPHDAYEIDVTARQWDWSFTYPGGHVSDTLHVAIDRPVRLNMNTEDVVHSLLVPALRINQAIIPGRISRVWFQADKVDTFTLRSSIYSGEWYADMRSALVTHSQPGFGAWLESVSDIFAGRTMVEVGELVYDRNGCAACHSTDGGARVGPTFKDLYGNTYETRSGASVLADDAYIRESILQPNASVVAGFEPVMTAYDGVLDDREIDALIAWLKSMSSHAPKDGEGE